MIDNGTDHPYSKSFGKERKLNSRHDFDRVFRKPKYRFSCFPVRVIAIPSTRDYSRIGVIVGKRALKRAVDRNRIKRVARESFRIETSDLSAFDFVVQFLPSSKHGINKKLKRHDSSELRHTLAEFWEKMRRELQEKTKL